MKKKNNASDKYITIQIPDGIATKYPNFVRYIRNMSPRERGRVLIDIYLFMSMAAQDRDALTKVQASLSDVASAHKDSEEADINKEMEVTEI